MKHNFKLGDRVFLFHDELRKERIDAVPFVVVGVRETEIECVGDWSGGTHRVSQSGWIGVQFAKHDASVCHSDDGKCRNSNVCQGLDYCMYLDRNR